MDDQTREGGGAILFCIASAGLQSVLRVELNTHRKDLIMKLHTSKFREHTVDVTLK